MFWIGCSSGFLNAYDPVTQKFRQYNFTGQVPNPEEKEINTTALLQDDNGRIYFGVNSENGDKISGSISLRRLDYTVIGDAVNIPQRLQSIAAPNQIVISEQAYEKVKESFSCRKIGESVLKNKTSLVVVYEVLD